MNIGRLILNAEKKISWTKAAAWIVGVSGALLTSGICPLLVIPYLKTIISVAGVFGVIGAKDTLDKNKKQ